MLQNSKIPKDEPDTTGVCGTHDQELWADDQKFCDDPRPHRAALASDCRHSALNRFCPKLQLENRSLGSLGRPSS